MVIPNKYSIHIPYIPLEPLSKREMELSKRKDRKKVVYKEIKKEKRKSR